MPTETCGWVAWGASVTFLASAPIVLPARGAAPPSPAGHPGWSSSLCFQGAREAKP